MGLMEQQKRLLSVSKSELPKKLYSYDGREYTLEIGKLIPEGSGFFCIYNCIFHDEIAAKSKTLKEAKRKLIIKLNVKWIETGLVGKEYDFEKHELKFVPKWYKRQ